MALSNLSNLFHGAKKLADRRRLTARPRLEPFEDRVLFAVVDWIGGSGDWNAAPKWSTGKVPGPDDDVNIATPGVTITHGTTAYDQVKSLTIANDAGVTLELNNGTLGVVNAEFNNNTVRLKGQSTLMIHSQASSSGPFELIEFDATISGAGTLTTHADATWTAGILDADWTVAEGATLNISGDKNKIIRGTFNNEGTVLWSGIGRIGVSSLTVINNLEGGLWVCQNDTPFLFRNDDGFADHPFNNFGTFRKEGATGSTAFDSWGPLFNFGRVEVNSGTLVVAGGGANHGTFAVAAGAQLQFITFNLNYDLKDGTTFEGDGKVMVTTGGTLSALVPITMPNPFELNAGTLRGDGPLTVNESFLWSGGQLTGNVTVAPGATMSITGNLSMVMKGKFNNFGSVTLTLPVPLAVTARSEIINHEGGVMDLQNNHPVEFHEDDGFAPWLFRNDGTLKKTAGTETSTIEHALFINSGAVEVHTGALFFDTEYFTPLDDHTLTEGTYTVKGVLKIEGADIHSNLTTVTLDGVDAKIVNENDVSAFANLAENHGFLNVLNGAEWAPAGDFANHGGLTIGSTGKVTVGGTFTQAAGVTSLFDGTIAASAVNIDGGYLGGFGTVEGDLTNGSLLQVGTLDGTGILLIDGNYTQLPTGTLLVRLGGPSAGAEHDQLQVTGTADLGGTLGVFMVAGYTPLPGETYRVLLAEAINDEFTRLRGPGSVMTAIYDPNGVILEPGRSANSSRSAARTPRVLARLIAMTPNISDFIFAGQDSETKFKRSVART